MEQGDAGEEIVLGLIARLRSAFSSQDEKEILDCVVEIKALSPEDAIAFINNGDVYTILSSHWRWDHAGEASDPICEWLGVWYQVDSQLYRNFVLQFLPEILWSFLLKQTQSIRLSGIETLLACIHNMSTYDTFGKPRKFSIPSTQSSSILHYSTKEEINETEGNFGKVEYSLKNLIVADVNKKLSLSGPVSKVQLVTESLFQLSNNFALLPPKAQQAFIMFCQCLATWGISRLKMKKQVHCVNGFLIKENIDEKTLVETMTNRFIPDIKQEINVPCSLKLYKESPMTFRDSYFSQCSKSIAFCLSGPHQSDALDTVRFFQARAQTELAPRSLLICNALLHKFDSRYSPY